MSNFKELSRDAFIVLGLTFLGGFIVGISGQGQDHLLAVAISNLIFSTLGFFIAGCLNKSNRFKHLSKVVLIVWVVSLVNLLFGITPLQWLSSIIFLFITMGIGGGLSLLFVKQQSEANA